ncbi:MAG: outer membrane lipoprotein carrier protein LolA [Proteobacteria bacterium]|nr:outer membrane lipoprotein carrier protein LolA [Pseudomonadota bacterium]MBU1741537.1 outer membrane lipoprotein carrier protein LolA [Pseudomonadota bacterium]
MLDKRRLMGHAAATGAGIILIVGLAGPLTVFAQKAPAARQIDIKTISARFVQIKRLKILNRPLISKGRFFFKAPDSIRWEYVSPVRSVLILKNGTARRFVFAGGKFVKDKSFRAETVSVTVGEMKNWLSGRMEHSRLFKVKRVSSAPVRLRLTPKDKRMTAFIQRVEITFGPKTGVAQRVDIIESQTAATAIEFRDVTINGPLPAKIFERPN